MLGNSAASPRELWNDYFAKRKPSPEDVGALVLALHNAKRYDHTIAAIEAALVQGQAQPWMYEVLALSMEIAGRDRAQIERVLMSRVDFTASDVPNMLYSAAYLTRFGAERQALDLYRQASKFDPTRREPYELGLKLARHLKDVSAIQWAAHGIMVTALRPDSASLRKDAQDAIADLRAELVAADRMDDVANLDRVTAEVQRRDLTLKLTWSGEGELDLIVREPAGTVCSFENRFSAGGGILMHDGYGPDPKKCYEEYVCPLGVPGAYEVRVHHVEGNIVGKRAQLEIVRYADSPDEIRQTVSIPITPDDQVVWVSLPRGRRTDLLPRPDATSAARRRSPALSFEQKLGPPDARSRAAVSQFVATQQVVSNVGSNAVGYQPVIQTISEGVSLGVRAVISGDRRYVRLSVSPQFTNVTDVFTFGVVEGASTTGN